MSRRPFYRRLEHEVARKAVLREDCTFDDFNLMIDGELENPELEDLALELPLWRVTSYRHFSGFAYLAVTCHHAINDGKGSLNLLQLLVQGREDFDNQVAASSTLFPDLKQHINMKPSMVYILGVVLEELVIPRLPSLLSAYLKGRPTWPNERLIDNPITFPARYEVFEVPASCVKATKVRAMSRGVPTLHPPIHAVGIFALWAALQGVGRHDEVVLKTTAPVSERNSHPSFPVIGGNYLSSSDWPCVASGSTDFWQLCSTYSHWISSSAGRSEARATTGMLAYVPDPADYIPHHGRDPTGWEGWLLDRVNSGKPFNKSLETSNLGRCPKLPAEIGQVTFTQRASVFGTAVVIGILGNQNGDLSVCVAWREGAAVDKTVMSAFVDCYRRAFAALGEIDSGKLSFDELWRATTD